MSNDIIVSVIVPVYNSESSIKECVKSLLDQTMPEKHREIILVDDGSNDNSLYICRKLKERHNNIKVVANEHRGVSYARNTGIKNADGKYMMFLDSDDIVREDTLSCVVVFFEKHYNETDMVTYKEESTVDGVKKKPHTRYRFFTEEKVYDLNKTPYAVQTRISICVKNNKKNILFDENLFFHEDQKYIMEILRDKMTIGFCTGGKYYWNRKKGGIMSKYLRAELIFEMTVSMYEEIFGWSVNVPRYYQAMLLHDINWKYNSNVLFPYKFEKTVFNRLLDRFRKLCLKIDRDLIDNHPTMREKTKEMLFKIIEKDYSVITDVGITE